MAKTPDKIELRWALPGALRIMAERRNQKDRWDESHDDSHSEGELVKAATGYIYAATIQTMYPDVSLRGIHRPEEFPDDWEWRPESTPEGNLIKAGALIAAELDRLARVKNG